MFEPFGMEHVRVNATTPTMFQTALRVLSNPGISVTPDQPPNQILDTVYYCGFQCTHDGSTNSESMAATFEEVTVVAS